MCYGTFKMEVCYRLANFHLTVAETLLIQEAAIRLDVRFAEKQHYRNIVLL